MHASRDVESSVAVVNSVSHDPIQSGGADNSGTRCANTRGVDIRCSGTVRDVGYQGGRTTSRNPLAARYVILHTCVSVTISDRARAARAVTRLLNPGLLSLRFSTRSLSLAGRKVQSALPELNTERRARFAARVFRPLVRFAHEDGGQVELQSLQIGWKGSPPSPN